MFCVLAYGCFICYMNRCCGDFPCQTSCELLLTQYKYLTVLIQTGEVCQWSSLNSRYSWSVVVIIGLFLILSASETEGVCSSTRQCVNGRERGGGGGEKTGDKGQSEPLANLTLKAYSTIFAVFIFYFCSLASVRRTSPHCLTLFDFIN